MPKVLRDLRYLHPALLECTARIRAEVIDHHKAPFRIFETGRTLRRQRQLVDKGRSNTLVSQHFFDLDQDPPAYATAVDYVYYNRGHWSWNLRKASIAAWYRWFGELVLDRCPELEWAGYWRENVDYSHFQLKPHVLVAWAERNQDE